jgi:hypothetical protein
MVKSGGGASRPPGVGGGTVETTTHLHLKRLAVRYLRGLGCQAVAIEVRCPIARYRVDVAGYLDRRPQSGNGRRVNPAKPAEPATVMIECKQSRSDFLRDQREADRLLDLRDELERLREHIEQKRIRTYEPHLRRTETSLFPELDEWDFDASRLRGYRQLIRRLRRLERQLHGETKFFMVARYRLADRLYLAAPRGMIRQRDLPRSWGLLECARRQPATGLHVAVEAPPQATRSRHRVRLLRNIAVAASRAALERTGA